MGALNASVLHLIVRIGDNAQGVVEAWEVARLLCLASFSIQLTPVELIVLDSAVLDASELIFAISCVPM